MELLQGIAPRTALEIMHETLRATVGPDAPAFVVALERAYVLGNGKD